MNKIICLLPLFMILFFACSKTDSSPSTAGSTGTAGTTATSGTTTMVKTIVVLAYNNQIAGKAIDSIITSYTYDQQNRPSAIVQKEYDSVSKPFDTTTYQFSYSQNSITVTTYAHGSSNASQQRIYYANATTLYLDSFIVQGYQNNAWQTTQKNVFSYGTDGYATSQVQTDYSSGSNTTAISIIKFTRANGDLLQSQIIPPAGLVGASVLFTYTYYNQKIATIASNDPATYAYKGLYSADFVKTINSQTTFQPNILVSTSTNAVFSSDAGRLIKDTLTTTTSAGNTTYAVGNYTYY